MLVAFQLSVNPPQGSTVFIFASVVESLRPARVPAVTLTYDGRVEGNLCHRIFTVKHVAALHDIMPLRRRIAGMRESA